MGLFTYTTKDDRGRTEVRVGKIAWHIVGFITLLAVVGMAGCPRYQVWSSQKEGEASFAKASKDREIKVLEAQAEIERAKGVAGANAIIADGLKGNEDYLRYLWIDKVAGNSNREIVYVPTEASLPILEAGKAAGK